MQAAILKVPAAAWTPAYDGDGQVRDGAWVADITGLLDLSSWPAGMRVIVRKERPHPGAQLRFTDLDGHRFTALATDARKGQLADLELRHRRRARCEDRIRNAKDTGLRNLPLKGYAQNQVWCEIVAMACELLAWTQMIALAGDARRWEPKRLRLRLFSIAGRLVRGGRRLRLRLAERWPWANEVTAAIARLQALPRLTSRNTPTNRKEKPRGPWNPARPARQPDSPARQAPEITHQPNNSGQHASDAKDRGVGARLASKASNALQAGNVGVRRVARRRHRYRPRLCMRSLLRAVASRLRAYVRRRRLHQQCYRSSACLILACFHPCSLRIGRTTGWHWSCHTRENERRLRAGHRGQ